MFVSFSMMTSMFVWGSGQWDSCSLYLSVTHPSVCFVFPSYRQLIYNYPEQLFAQAGVMAIEHADFAGIERLALVTGVYAYTNTQK